MGLTPAASRPEAHIVEDVVNSVQAVTTSSTDATKRKEWVVFYWYVWYIFELSSSNPLASRL